MIDLDERRDYIAATVANFRSGEFGINRFRAALASCGLNASEIQEYVDAHEKENEVNSRAPSIQTRLPFASGLPDDKR